jgi:uncharacterized membrane protein YraQ (UPF0718 family)
MTQTTTAPPPPPTHHRRRGPLAAAIAVQVVAVILALHPFDSASARTWTTIFLAITFQALPFLVLGVVLSGAIAAFVPPGTLGRVLPRNPAVAVPVAGIAGVALPGCECASVPLAGRAVAAGVAPPAALAFLLAAPAINPVVLVSTAVAFPNHPEMVVARFAASLVTAVLVGWLWLRIGRDDLVERARQRVPTSGVALERMRASVVHDFLHAGGYLIVGAAVAATLQVIVPRSVLTDVGGTGVAAVLVMALLAVVLAICSEADAFVAASLTQFSRTAQLTFMVVGPVVDLKLVAMQAGTFGRDFAMRFAPLTLLVAVVSAVVVGSVLL